MLSLSDIVEAARQRPARAASPAAREAPPSRHAPGRQPERFTLGSSDRAEASSRARAETRPERAERPREADRPRAASDGARTATASKPVEGGRGAREVSDRREAEATSQPRAKTPDAARDRAQGAVEGAFERRTGREDEREAPEGVVAAAAESPPEPPAPPGEPGHSQEGAEALPAALPEGQAPAPVADEAATSEPNATTPAPAAQAQAAPSSAMPAAAPAAAIPEKTADAAPGAAQGAAPGAAHIAARDGRPAGAGETASVAQPRGEAATTIAIDPAAIGFEAALAATDPASAGSMLSASGATPAASAASGPSDVKATAQPSAQPQTPPIPLGAVPMTIGLRALGGTNRFEIRLDPVELGRIDVELEIDKERGAVSARLVVERPETLALLQRDAGSLQQALSQAGFDAAAGISLSLRGDSEGRSGERGDMPAGTRAHRDGDDTLIPIEAAPATALRSLGGLDIRI